MIAGIAWGISTLRGHAGHAATRCHRGQIPAQRPDLTRARRDRIRDARTRIDA